MEIPDNESVGKRLKSRRDWPFRATRSTIFVDDCPTSRVAPLAGFPDPWGGDDQHQGWESKVISGGLPDLRRLATSAAKVRQVRAEISRVAVKAMVNAWTGDPFEAWVPRARR